MSLDSGPKRVCEVMENETLADLCEHSKGQEWVRWLMRRKEACGGLTVT